MDQEGAFSGHEMASLCDKFGIERIVTGSDPVKSHGKARHTATGLAEKHIHLLKSTMLKLHADAVERGLDVSKEDLVAESSMAHNCLLTFNGVSPVTGVLGRCPRDLYEIDNTTLDAQPSHTADLSEVATHLRILAKSAALQTVAEQRLSLAQHTNPQQVEPEALKTGSLVDLYRTPSHRDMPGWRGPAVMLDSDDETGNAIVKWQGKPCNVPFRHIRLHVGFLAFLLRMLSSSVDAANFVCHVVQSHCSTCKNNSIIIFDIL